MLDKLESNIVASLGINDFVGMKGGSIGPQVSWLLKQIQNHNILQQELAEKQAIGYVDLNAAQCSRRQNRASETVLLSLSKTPAARKARCHRATLLVMATPASHSRSPASILPMA